MSSYFYKDTNAPRASAIHVGTAVAVWFQNRILFDHRQSGDWGLIGGALELGESLEECVRRETLEETGLRISSLRLLGLFSHPSRIIGSANHAVQSVTICFSAESTTDQIQLSEESVKAKFCTQEEARSLSIVSTHSMIVPYLFKPELWPVLE